MSLIKELLEQSLLEQSLFEQDERTNIKIFVDLDGVLANFVGGARRLIPEYSEEKYDTDPKFKKMMWKTIRDYSEDGGELWYELDLLPDAMTLWNYVKDYDPEILTATGDPKYNAGQQKFRWVAEKFGSHIPVNLTRKAAEKAQHACEKCVLIDDKEKAINPWKEAGGTGILHTSAANTIAQLKQLGL